MMQICRACAILASALWAVAALEQTVSDEITLLQRAYQAPSDSTNKQGLPGLANVLSGLDPDTVQGLTEAALKLLDTPKVQEGLKLVQALPLGQIVEELFANASSADKMPDISKIMELASKFAPTPDASGTQTAQPALKMPDLSQVMELAAKFAPLLKASDDSGAQPALKMPDLSKVLELAANFAPAADAPDGQRAQPAFKMPDLGQVMELAAKLAPPANGQDGEQQAPDLGKLMQGASKLFAPVQKVDEI